LWSNSAPTDLAPQRREDIDAAQYLLGLLSGAREAGPVQLLLDVMESTARPDIHRTTALSSASPSWSPTPPTCTGCAATAMADEMAGQWIFAEGLGQESPVRPPPGLVTVAPTLDEWDRCADRTRTMVLALRLIDGPGSAFRSHTAVSGRPELPYGSETGWRRSVGGVGGA
jgi:hypothetical protein